MWIQREAQLIGRTAPNPVRRSRDNRKPKPSQQSPENETGTAEQQECLPGLEVVHLGRMLPWPISRGVT